MDDYGRRKISLIFDFAPSAAPGGKAKRKEQNAKSNTATSGDFEAVATLFLALGLGIIVDTYRQTQASPSVLRL